MCAGARTVRPVADTRKLRPKNALLGEWEEHSVAEMVERTLAVTRGRAADRAIQMRSEAAEAPVANRAELEQELRTLKAKLDRWETKSRGLTPSPKKVFMIDCAKQRAEALAKAIAQLANGAVR
jgi:hypothetical protein